MPPFKYDTVCPHCLPSSSEFITYASVKWTRLAERVAIITSVKSSSQQGWLSSSFCSEMFPHVQTIWLHVTANGSPLCSLVSSVFHFIRVRLPKKPELQTSTWRPKLHQAAEKHMTTFGEPSYLLPDTSCRLLGLCVLLCMLHIHLLWSSKQMTCKQSELVSIITN